MASVIVPAPTPGLEAKHDAQPLSEYTLDEKTAIAVTEKFPVSEEDSERNETEKGHVGRDIDDSAAAEVTVNGKTGNNVNGELKVCATFNLEYYKLVGVGGGRRS